MELLQVLQNRIPQKKKVLTQCFKKDKQDISKFLLQIMKNTKKDIKDIKILNVFFIELYDMMYYDIVIGKIRIVRKIFRLLQELALPFEYIGKQKWHE